MMKVIFWDTEPWRDACFKRVRAYLEMFQEVGNVRIPKKPH